MVDVEDYMVNMEDAGYGKFLAYKLRMDPEGIHPILPAGDYTWPFSFELPVLAPPSFTGATRIPFKSFNFIKVIIRQEGILRQDIVKQVPFRVRYLMSGALYRSLTLPQLEWAERMERVFWRDGGALGIKAKFLNSVLVPGEFCEAEVQLDMKDNQVKILYMELRLYQRILSTVGVDIRWKEVPLAISEPTPTSSNIKPGSATTGLHSTILQLMVPEELEDSPSMETTIGSCEYYVMLFICPDTGPTISKLVKMPLLPSSSLLSARSVEELASLLPHRYSAPTSKENAHLDSPPAYFESLRQS